MILPAPVLVSGDVHSGRHRCLGLMCAASVERWPDGVGDVLHWQSRGSGTCESPLPFTPFCVLPDFVLALTSVCSLDPMLLQELLPQQCWEVLQLQGRRVAGKGLVLSLVLTFCTGVAVAPEPDPVSSEWDLPAARDQETAFTFHLSLKWAHPVVCQRCWRS